MSSIRIFHTDDHPLFRAGLRQTLETEAGFEVVGEASNGAETIELIRNSAPDILILDISMPVMNGVDTARKCREEGIDVEIIFLTMHQERTLFRAAADLGVRGYVLKESATEEIIEAVRTVVRGSEYISRALAGLLLKPASTRNRKEDALGLKSLTESEFRILALVSTDRTSKEIADELGLSIRTVENHRNRASKKLGLSGSHSFVKFAFKHRKEIQSMMG